MASIENDNNESSPELEDDVIKVMVIGEPRCGKTSFIRAYYDRHIPGFRFSHNGFEVYPCRFRGNNKMGRISFYEILGDPDFLPEERKRHYEQADIFVFMYAIDDPSSLQRLASIWIEEAMNIITTQNMHVVFIGAKKDLRDNQHVIERLALENQSPVTFQQGSELLRIVPGLPVIHEWSVHNITEFDTIFNTIIFDMLLVNE